MALTELLNTLYVQTQGAALFLDHDAVRVTAPDRPGHQALPLRRLSSIIAFGHVSISPDLLRRCAEDGRNVVWMSRSGRFLARVDGPVQGNVLLRHAQHLAHADPVRRLAIARCCVAGKVQNSRRMLLRSARDAESQQQEELRQIADELASVITTLPDVPGIDELLGAEGNAARLYYRGFAALLRPGEGIPPFALRTKRPPTDPVNAVLSFAYGLLRASIQGSAEEVGLDPYVGFLHGLRPGKPALALDLMEEYRPVFADRLVLTLFNRRQLQRGDFEELPGGAVRLSEDGRKLVLSEWQQSTQREWPHTLLGRSVPAALLPSVQARLLARHLRGELPSYMPWLVK
ncbi:MAG: type I-C CRISPR-associated endonuclease Cas1c [Streptosporangiaceae bacterium]